MRFRSPSMCVGPPPHGDCGAEGQPGRAGVPALVLQWIKSCSYLCSGRRRRMPSLARPQGWQHYPHLQTKPKCVLPRLDGGIKRWCFIIRLLV